MNIVLLNLRNFQRGIYLTNATIDTALLQQVELQSQPQPTKHNLNILQHFLASEHGCHNELRGIDSTIWDVEGDTRDFLSLSNKHARRDLFSRWLGDTFLKWWHERIRSPCLVCSALSFSTSPLVPHSESTIGNLVETAP